MKNAENQKSIGIVYVDEPLSNSCLRDILLLRNGEPHWHFIDLQAGEKLEDKLVEIFGNQVLAVLMSGKKSNKTVDDRIIQILKINKNQKQLFMNPENYKTNFSKNIPDVMGMSPFHAYIHEQLFSIKKQKKTF